MLQGVVLEVEQVDRLYRLLTRGTRFDDIARFFGSGKHFFAYRSSPAARRTTARG